MQNLTETCENTIIRLWNRKRLIYLSWHDVNLAINHIASRLHEDNFLPEVIVGVARGGLIPAVLLSHILEIRDLVTVNAKFYGRGHYPKRLAEKPVIENISLNKDYDNALLVDDIAGSGGTIVEVKSRLKNHIRSVRTATLVKNERCPIHVDYFFRIVEDFVVFPWEISQEQLDYVTLPETFPLLTTKASDP